MNFKINNYNLLGEKVANEYKFLKSKRLLDKLKCKIDNFKKISQKKKITSSTNIPFFDINYKVMAQLISKDSDHLLSDAQELQIFHQNLRFFERVFGFNFNNNKSLLMIRNQSLITLDHVYPQIRAFNDKRAINTLLDEPVREKKESTIDNIMESSKDFKLLSEKSGIMNTVQAFKIEKNLPNYLKGVPWKLYYSRHRDGTSYKT